MEKNSNYSLALNALAIVGILAILFIVILFAVKLSQAIANIGSNATTASSNWITATANEISSASQSPSIGNVVTYSQPASTGGTQSGQNYYIPAPVTTQVVTQSPTAPIVGKPDLAVTILATGVIDPTTGAFTSTNLIYSSQRAAVRFEVQNIGTAPSGSWEFDSVVRQFSQEIFTSPVEPSLNPGDKIVYTMSYDGIAPDNTNTSVSTFTVNINPTDSYNDGNLNNDVATTQFNVIQN
jgi:hypothetical protein